jgi:hypothetical protein
MFDKDNASWRAEDAPSHRRTIRPSQGAASAADVLPLTTLLKIGDARLTDDRYVCRSVAIFFPVFKYRLSFAQVIGPVIID